VALACLSGGFLLAAVFGPVSVAAQGRPPVSTPVSLRVSVGYGNIYRGTSWTPVRVTIRNRSSTDISGNLNIPQSDQSTSVVTSPAFHSLYQAPVTLPADATKHITVYVPGSGIGGSVSVSFTGRKALLARAGVYPVGVDNGTLLIGALGSSSSDIAWIGSAIQHSVTTHVVPLSAATLDPVAQALSTFDIIVLTDTDSSQLDGAQLQALEAYVRGGGSLLLVGGPTWQRTLRPLPAALLPGRLGGTRLLSDLHGLAPLGAVPAGGRSAVSVLRHPDGTVWASQGGVPLVVRREVGEGVVEYLAFDPALSALPPGSPILQHIVAMAAPAAVTRTWAPGGFRARFEAVFRTMALTSELANVPAQTLPLLAVFAGLALLYVLVLGPANFLILRRLGRQHLALVTMPALSLVFLGGGAAVAARLRAPAVSVNTVSVVNLAGTTAARPATMYVSLAAPLPGTYRLAYGASALPAALPQLSAPIGFSPRSASTLHNTPLGMALQEEQPTSATFLSMKRWSTRDLTLTTSLRIPGAMQSTLHLNSLGTVVGTVRNGTNLTLENPAIIAGQTVVHLHTLHAGATAAVRVHPGEAPFGADSSSIWGTVYGNGQPNFSDGFGGFGGFGDCCDQVSAPPENTLAQREQNAISMLAQAQTLPSPSGVLLAGWTRQPLGTFRVDGAAPQRRDLTLVVTPLAVHFPPRGAFRLPAGTIAAHLVDILPRAPQSGCSSTGNCSGFGWGGFGGRDDGASISVGAGGSLTFEFDLPEPSHIRFTQLALGQGNSSDNLGPAAVYDWHSGRWAPVDFSTEVARLAHPQRFISTQGQILVRLHASGSTGDLSISDEHDAVTLSGRGVAS
jgi:hypothetical protein